jgi:hypothetical protein
MSERLFGARPQPVVEKDKPLPLPALAGSRPAAASGQKRSPNDVRSGGSLLQHRTLAGKPPIGRFISCFCIRGNVCHA